MILRLTAGVLVVAALGVSAGAGPAVPDTDGTAVHVLNRLGYGPRPGDVAQVRAVGVAAWIERQLHPERIADEALEARLAPLDTLRLSSRRIVQDYDRPAIEERRRRQREAGKDPAAANANADEPQPEREPPTEAQRKNRQVMDDLADAKLLRAVYSDRQLEAVLTDFWFNHFNVFAGKGPTRDYVTEYERDVIRPRVFGRFRDLLGAVAKSPAMLFYLDNWENVDPHAADRAAAMSTARALRSRRGFLPAARPQAARPRGLNENYARELLELHTLGVDGGYTQADIVAVARAFTGWTMQPRQGTGFTFAAALHDPNPKTVLGHTLPPNAGMADGERVLDIVAEHPSTARFIALKLARRFVSDTPPQALVDRAAARFRETRGDLREVVRAIVTSPEFFAADAAGAKLKTPFEFMASALRATGAEVVDARPLARTLRELGMPSYLCQPPTGYGDTAEAWASPGMLVSRVNFALALSAGRVRGVRVPTGDAAMSASLVDPAFQHR